MIDRVFRLCVAMLVLSAFGCSSIENRVIGPVISSPEVLSSRFAVPSLSISLAPNWTYEADRSGGTRPYVPIRYEDPQPRTALTLGGSLTLSHRFDISLSSYSGPVGGEVDSSAGARTSVRYQFLGDPTNKAKVGWKGLVSFARLISAITSKGDQKDFLGAGGYPWSSEATSQGTEVGLSVGYRRSAGHMVYGGIAYQSYGFGGTLKQERSVTGDFPEATYDLPKDRGEQRALSIATQHGITNHMTAQLSFVQNKWRGELFDFFHVNLAFDWNFFAPLPVRLQPTDQTTDQTNGND